MSINTLVYIETFHYIYYVIMREIKTTTMKNKVMKYEIAVWYDPDRDWETTQQSHTS